MREEIEQRLQRRFADPGGLLGRISAGGSDCSVRVADLSLGGAGLQVTQPRILQPRRHLCLGLELPEGASETEIDLVHVGGWPPGFGQRLGVSFRPGDRRFLRRLCRYLVEHNAQLEERPVFITAPGSLERVAEPERVRRVLVHCCRRRVTMRLFSHAGEPLGTFAPRALRQGRLVGQARLAGRPVRAGRWYYLGLPSLTRLHVFMCLAAAQDGDDLAFEQPSEMLEASARKLGRLSALDDFPVVLELLHPQIPGKLISKRALEAGLGGLRFALDLEQDLLAVGTIIESAFLRLPGRCSVACRCAVRHIVRRQQGGYECGVELVGFSPGGQQLWVDTLLERMSPDVVTATAFEVQAAWDIFERSGYLEEKPVELMRALEAPFLATWRTLAQQRSSSRLWLHRSGEEHDGTISATRIYRDTWLVHHMAVERSVPALQKLRIVAELGPRVALQWIHSSFPAGAVLIYYNADNPFNRRPYGEFFDRNRGSPHVSVREVTALDGDAEQLAGLPGDLGGPVVRPCAAEELPLACEHLRRIEGELVYQAFDYHPERVALPASAAGGFAERAILVAVDGRQLVGCAVVECGRPAANVFSLFDTCRPSIMAAGASAARQAGVLRALVVAAAGWFLRRGRGAFLCLLDVGDAAALPDLEGFRVPLVRALLAPAMVICWAGHIAETWGA